MVRMIFLNFAAFVTASSAQAQPETSTLQADVAPAWPGPQVSLHTVPDGRAESGRWNRVFGQAWVRNVSVPSLYPIMPLNGRANGKAVIVVLGGGYSFVSIESEGFRVAERLAAEGYMAFVLKYRPRATPTDDGRLDSNRNEAEVREHAGQVPRSRDDLSRAKINRTGYRRPVISEQSPDEERLNV